MVLACHPVIFAIVSLFVVVFHFCILSIISDPAEFITASFFCTLANPTRQISDLT